MVLLCMGVVGFVWFYFSGGGPANWKEYAPGGGGFTVLMPGAPSQKDKNDPEIVSATPIHEAVAQSPSKISYSVEYYDLAGRPINDYLYISWIKHRMLADGGKVAREKDITLSPYGGKEIVVKLPNNQVLVRRVYLAEARVFWVSAKYADSPTPPSEVQKFLDSFKITSVAKAPETPVAMAAADPPKPTKKNGPATKKNSDPPQPPVEPKKPDPPKSPDNARAGVTADEDMVIQAINRVRGEKKLQLVNVAPKLMEAARDSARASAENKNALISNELGYPHVNLVGPITLNGGTAADLARFIEERAKKPGNLGSKLANPKSRGIGVGLATTPAGAIICMLFFGGDR